MSKRFLGSWGVAGGVAGGSWSGKELGSTDWKLALIMEGRKNGGPRGLSMVIQKGSQMETRAASSKVGEGPGWDRCQGGGLQAGETSAGRRASGMVVGVPSGAVSEEQWALNWGQRCPQK